MLAFIATNDQELIMMKNKVTRDLDHNRNVNEDKVKQIRNYMNDQFDASKVQTETTFELVKDKQKKMDEKLAQVEVSEVVFDYIDT